MGGTIKRPWIAPGALWRAGVGLGFGDLLSFPGGGLASRVVGACQSLSQKPLVYRSIGRDRPSARCIAELVPSHFAPLNGDQISAGHAVHFPILKVHD